MNATQRKTVLKQGEELKKAVEALGQLADLPEALKRIAGQVDDVKTAVEEVRDDLQSKLDEMSEKAREGDKAQDMEAAKDQLDNIVSTLEENTTALEEDSINELSGEELKEKLTEIKDGLEEAVDTINEL